MTRNALLARLREPDEALVEVCARAMVLQWGGDPDTTETSSSALPRPKMWQLYAEQARAALRAAAAVIEGEPTGQASNKAPAPPDADA